MQFCLTHPSSWLQTPKSKSTQFFELKHYLCLMEVPRVGYFVFVEIRRKKNYIKTAIYRPCIKIFSVLINILLLR